MTGLMRSVSGWLAATVLMLCLQPGAAFAQSSCTREDFAAAVDEAGEALRTYNSEATPQLAAKLRQLKTRKGWNDSDYEQMALDYLHDARLAGLDRKANDLLVKVDELGRTDEEVSPDCSRLAELKASSLELLAVMKAKSRYLIGKIDGELNPAQARAKSAMTPAGEEEARKRMLVPPDELRYEPPAPQSVERSADAGRPNPEPAPPVTRTAPAPEPEQPWSTTTDAAPGAPPPAEDPARGTDTVFLQDTPGQNLPDYGQPESLDPGQDLPPEAFSDPEGYTIEEIRDASRGFFGSMSTSLAAVIEHAFREWGRPTAYVLGSEGGGALLAGLRYGKGSLYLRRGGTRTVHWHGPSLGYDFGAESSRTMFLIYGMNEPEQLFRRYVGVDGSAYLVGGVGLTLLKGGPTIMAPIRTGLGLRVGANVGYLRFTPEATWNPF